MLVMTGCATPTGGDSTTPRGSQTSTGQGSTASRAPISTGSLHSDVTPRTDLQHQHVVPWTTYELVDDHTIRVHFLLGDPKCYAAHATVRETTDTITITVLEGSLPNAPDNCPLDAAQAAILVTTDTPVADRRITQP